MNRKSSGLTLIILCFYLNSIAQTISPDLQNKSLWNLISRSARTINENGKSEVFLNAMPGDGALLVKDLQFSSGTIEVDIKGEDLIGQSFVGIGFHVQKDSSYDAVYFRPFNFLNVDTLRRKRAVQYVAVPNHQWETLREKWPGKYENEIISVKNANDWFHVKLVVSGNTIKAFVNNDVKPCLEVQKLSSTTNGGIALWVGNNSSGSFANLQVTSE